MPSLKTGDIQQRAWWRGIDEVADPASIAATFADEFSHAPDLLAGQHDRRHFLRIMGASMAMAGLGVSGCRRWPAEHIVPYASRPEGTMPGVPEVYASCVEFDGIAQGVLVSSSDGKPTKIEGSPEHPDSRGSTDAFMQARILDLYDPDRSRGVATRAGGTRHDASLKDFLAWMQPRLGRGEGVAVLAEPSSSPTLHRMRRAFEEAYPAASWTNYTPISTENERLGLERAFGGQWRAVHDLSAADVIVSLGADPLGPGAMQTTYTRDWASGRLANDGIMNRLWIVEPGLSLTGANADERRAMHPARIVAVAAHLAQVLAGVSNDQVQLAAADRAWAEDVAADLARAGGHGLVLAGRDQPPLVHYLAAAINDAMGSAGSAVTYHPITNGADGSTIAQLSEAMRTGSVKTLLILGGNPAYDAPADTGFASALVALDGSAHLSLHEDETSQACTWHVNAAHWLEAWGDGRASDGTVCIQQPLILPLFGGVSAIELLSTLAGHDEDQGRDLVRGTFSDGRISGWDPAWRKAVHDGVVPGSASKGQVPAITFGSPMPAGEAKEGDLVVVFSADGSTWDGRFANNGWMQEVPDTLTKLTWDNAALLSPATADALGVRQGDVMTVSVGDASIEIAALPVPGIAEHVIVLPLGYGRRFDGRVCSGAGVDVYPLRSSHRSWEPASAVATGATYPLAITQMHFAVDSTPGKGLQERLPMLFREGTLEQYKADPKFAAHVGHTVHSLSMWEDQKQFEGADYRWGMSIDLTTCTGCNACVTACQAENNIPIVGKDQVLVGREMHWIRIDRYFAFDEDGHGGWDADALKGVALQPLTCHHCENAPCEQVCPVAATIHDEDGLNVMVYNRCVGTRYCSNNCPFKVRRFNYFDYYRREPLRSTGLLQVQPDYYLRRQSGGESLRSMQFNPDVTVRMRGVMEKCTFCTQRIQRAKITTKNAWVKMSDAQKERDMRVAIPDGMITSACEQACPAGCIVFGDLADPTSRVSAAHGDDRAYELLSELNIKARTRYLARLTNPLHSSAPAAGGHH